VIGRGQSASALRSTLPGMARRSRKQIVLTDPRAIRALSHPARLVVIDELFAGRVATSTELAELAGLTPSAMSYHLRALAGFGIVERVETSTDGRERPWRAAGRNLSIRSLPSRAQQAAGTLLIGTMLDQVKRYMENYINAEAQLPQQWRTAANFDAGVTYLTASECRELADRMGELMQTYRRRSDGSRPDARRVQLAVAVVPHVDEADVAG
jgi:DNA-binding transcriptional ArsR family regulator